MMTRADVKESIARMQALLDKFRQLDPGCTACFKFKDKVCLTYGPVPADFVQDRARIKQLIAVVAMG